MWQNWPVIGWCRSVSLFVSMLSVFNPHKLCCRADIDHIDRTDDRTAADVDLQNIHCLPAIRLPAICLCFLFLLPLVWSFFYTRGLSQAQYVSHWICQISLLTLMLSAWGHDECVHTGAMHRSWVVWKQLLNPVNDLKYEPMCFSTVSVSGSAGPLCV